jgi:hypothetical protein
MRGSPASYLLRRLFFRLTVGTVALAGLLRIGNPHISLLETFTSALTLLILFLFVGSVVSACARALAVPPNSSTARHVFLMHRFPIGMDYILGGLFLLKASLLLA